MSKKLVIVESPAKAHTISNFLGKDFTVKRDFVLNVFGCDSAHLLAVGPAVVQPHLCPERACAHHGDAAAGNQRVLDERTSRRFIGWILLRHGVLLSRYDAVESLLPGSRGRVHGHCPTI